MLLVRSMTFRDYSWSFANIGSRSFTGDQLLRAGYRQMKRVITGVPDAHS